MAEFFLAPFQFDFMRHALAASLLVGGLCGVVGVFVVLRGMAYFGDALAHAMLPGLAIGYVLHGAAAAALFWWGLGAAVLSALVIGWISRRGGLREDSAIGIVLAGMLALGVALVSRGPRYAIDLAHFLFGNVLGISAQELLFTGAFCLAVAVALTLFHKELVLVAFDETLARTLRLPAGALYFLMLILIAVTIGVSIQTVGLGLMLALLVAPAATALQLSRRLTRVIALAGAIGGGSGYLGLCLSYRWEIPSGAAIVLVNVALFVLALVLGRARPAVGSG
jgi:manganese/iron transport system permease protein